MEHIEFTEELLKQMPQDVLIKLALMLQQNINQLNKNIEPLTERVHIMNQKKNR